MKRGIILTLYIICLLPLILGQSDVPLDSEPLELQQINVDKFELGRIVKMQLLIENKWSEEIDDVHTQMQIYDATDNLVGEFNSSSTQIAALRKKILTSFWDTAEIKPGTYNATATIYYANETKTYSDLQLVMNSDQIEIIGIDYILSEKGGREFDISENLLTIVIVIIGIVILLNIVWFLMFKKYLKK